jgi:hypothetical protein
VRATASTSGRSARKGTPDPGQVASPAVQAEWSVQRNIKPRGGVQPPELRLGIGHAERSKGRERAEHGRGPCLRCGCRQSLATSVFRNAERASCLGVEWAKCGISQRRSTGECHTQLWALSRISRDQGGNPSSGHPVTKRALRASPKKGGGDEWHREIRDGEGGARGGRCKPSAGIRSVIAVISSRFSAGVKANTPGSRALRFGGIRLTP